MTKTLLVIDGCMGVDKTPVAQAPHRRLSWSVWLDGDWCCVMDAWGISGENKRMVEDSSTYLLRSCLSNDSFDNVLFGWVMHRGGAARPRPGRQAR